MVRLLPTTLDLAHLARWLVPTGSVCAVLLVVGWMVKDAIDWAIQLRRARMVDPDEDRTHGR